MWILLYLIFGISQLGFHFWPDWSFVYGIKVDYLSPTLYFLDLIWIGAVLSNFQKKKKVGKYNSASVYVWIGLFLINVLLADRWQIAVYKWFRLWQFWWWVKYLNVNKEKIAKVLPIMIGWWVIVEVVLGLGQVINGGNVGGIFYWLGERRFSYMTPGIARVSWFGDNFVRAYGTFSHPNSLAGFLVAAGILFNRVYINVPVHKTWKWVVNWLIVVGTILTGSRLIWMVIGLLCLYKARMKFGLKTLLLGIMLMVLGLLFENRLDWLGGWSSESLSMRINLNKIALKMINLSPIFGIGLGNFLVKLPEMLSGFWIMQPVHNVIFLSLTQLGLVGFVWMVVFFVKKIELKKFGLIWMVILMTGMFDHYWLSLPQNVFLLSVIAGLSLKHKGA